jgi:hypothetical protein
MKPCIFTARGSTVCFTAPHARSYESPTKGSKLADLYTGEIAAQAADLSNSSVLRLNAPYGSGRTWRYKYFKKALHQTVPKSSLLLDIHGAGGHHPFEICFGTGYMNPANHPMLNAAIQLARVYGFKYAVNHPFAGKSGLTAYWQKRNGDGTALQIELHRALRDMDADGATMQMRTVPFLAELALMLENR